MRSLCLPSVASPACTLHVTRRVIVRGVLCCRPRASMPIHNAQPGDDSSDRRSHDIEHGSRVDSVHGEGRNDGISGKSSGHTSGFPKKWSRHDELSPLLENRWEDAGERTANASRQDRAQPSQNGSGSNFSRYDAVSMQPARLQADVAWGQQRGNNGGPGEQKLAQKPAPMLQDNVMVDVGGVQVARPVLLSRFVNTLARRTSGRKHKDAGQFNTRKFGDFTNEKGARMKSEPLQGGKNQRRGGRPQILPHVGLLVCNAIIWDKKQERVLLGQRLHGKNHAGMWEFPGGKVDHGDGSVASALMREVLEEVGVTVEVGDFKPATFWIHGSPKMLILLFSCTKYQGRAHGREGQQVAWASMQDLKNEKYQLLGSHKTFARWVIDGHTMLESEKKKL